MLLPRSGRPDSVFFARKGPGILALSGLFALAATFAILEMRAGNETLVPFFLLLTVLVCGWTILSMRYEIHEDVLMVRASIVRLEISLDRIVGCWETRRSGPGLYLSSGKLQIDYVREDGAPKSVLIAPDDPEGFLRELRLARVRVIRERGEPDPNLGTFTGSLGEPPDGTRIEL